MGVMRKEGDQRAQIISEALPYIQKFHGRRIVVKYGGNAMLDEKLKNSFARDLVLMKLVGMDPVVVHGGGPQIDEALSRIGKQGHFHRGMRVTDAETMTIVESVLVDQLNSQMVKLINNNGGQAIGLSGKSDGFIKARKLHLEPAVDGEEIVDLGYVGDVGSINPEIITKLDSRKIIPVIAPVGLGPDGGSYNINADLVAGKVAEVLAAEKLVLLTNSLGVLDGRGDLLSRIDAQEIEALVADGTIHSGMLPKLSSAVAAVNNGVKNAHIIDGRIEHALLLEVLTDHGVGTLIQPS